jgi:hypothetical protein
MKKFFTALLLSVISYFASAQEVYTEAFAVDYNGLRGHSIYAELSFDGKKSLFLSAYKDSQFSTTYVGYARTFSRVGDSLQTGLGVGEAKYDGATTFGINPWAWYESEKLTAYAEVELFKDDSEGYYYRAYTNRAVWKGTFMGIYTERTVGTGPSVGYKIDGRDGFLQFMFVKPTWNKPGFEATDYVAYLTVGLSF